MGLEMVRRRHDGIAGDDWTMKYKTSMVEASLTKTHRSGLERWPSD